MKIIKTKIKGLVIIKTNIFKDRRGSFKEVFRKKILNKNFIFDCLSHSKKNILRGLHLQLKKPQAKMITIVRGKILDVAVDLRKNSKTFGKTFLIEMSEDSDFSLFIPRGFAHGFLCKSKKCTVYYKCDNYRNKNSEKTIQWNDKNLKIKWKIKKPILSKKDKLGLTINEFKKLI
tara:strand:- start:414 stop:938 length:525 start_codon:yes stop_codon:yes gene_type:complete